MRLPRPVVVGLLIVVPALMRDLHFERQPDADGRSGPVLRRPFSQSVAGNFGPAGLDGVG